MESKPHNPQSVIGYDDYEDGSGSDFSDGIIDGSVAQSDFSKV